MHEMSLAEGVLQLVEENARQAGALRVKTVVLEIGRLAAVMPEALQFCFEAVARGSIAADAALEIVSVPGAGWCSSCQTTVPLEEMLAPCPCCGDYPVQPTAGTEMRVKEIEIE